MAEININPKAVEGVNSQLPSIINRVSEVKSVVSQLISTIDNKILDYSDLRVRLNSSQNDITEMECNLNDLHRTINTIAVIYEENELRLVGRVSTLKEKV